MEILDTCSCLTSVTHSETFLRTKDLSNASDPIAAPRKRCSLVIIEITEPANFKDASDSLASFTTIQDLVALG